MSDNATNELIDYLSLNRLYKTEQIIEFLREGADPTARDKNGISTLMYAAESDMYDDVLEFSLYSLYKKENNIESNRIFFDDGDYADNDIDGSDVESKLLTDDEDYSYDNDEDYYYDNSDKGLIDYDAFDYDVAREYGANASSFSHKEQGVSLKIKTPAYIEHLNEALHIAVKSNAVTEKNIKMLAMRGANIHANVNGMSYMEASLNSVYYRENLVQLAELKAPSPSFDITGQPFLMSLRERFREASANEEEEILSTLTKMASNGIDVTPLRIKKSIIGPDGKIDKQAEKEDENHDDESSILLSLDPGESEWNKLTKVLYASHLDTHPGWSYDEYHSRLQSMLFAHACGIPEDLSKKDPPGWAKEYEDLNTIRNHDGSIRSHRDSLTAAHHTQDFLDALSKQTILPALINRHPKLLEAFGKDIIEQTKVDLRHVIGQTLFDAHHPTNTPAPGRIKILKASKKQLLNNTHIRKGAKDPDLLIKGEWEALSAPVQGPNGYWIVPITTPEAVNEEANDRNHCLDQHLHRFLFDGIQPMGIRRDPQVADYTAAVEPNNKGDGYTVFSKPYGYQDETAPPAAHADWEWYVDQLNKGVWGKPADKIRYGQNRIDLLRADPTIDETVIRIGFDPTGKKGFEFAERAWSVWGHYMGDLMRYRKMPLKEMLEQSGVNQKLDEVAAKHMARAIKYGFISYDTPDAGLNSGKTPSPAP